MDLGTFIDDFRDRLPRLDAERAGEALYGAPHLSMFDVLGAAEMQLSRVYAMLLDPEGAHGQGSLFLNALMRAVGLPHVRRDGRVTVRTEAPITDGRIDILIETPAAVMAVENKPYAGLGPRQLKCYSDYLTTRGETPTCLLFLCQWGEEAGDGIEGVHRMPYAGGSGSFAKVLRGTLLDIRAEQTRHFVEDVIRHMERRMGGIEMAPTPLREEIRSRLEGERPEETARILAEVVADQDVLRDWALDRIGRAILDGLGAGVSTAFRNGHLEKKPVASENMRLSRMEWGKDHCVVFARPGWPEGCHLGFGVEMNIRKNVFYGVSAPKVSPICEERGRVEDAIASLGPDFVDTTENYWPAWRRADPFSWTTAEVARITVETDGRPEMYAGIQKMISDMQDLAGLLDKKSGA